MNQAASRQLVVPEATEGREQRLSLDELFFSRTDGKGIIQSGNAVFVRVSGYASEALVGQPHNLVRHPDMPRALFRVFWEQLLAGSAITAYVKNRAADGSYYWVLATADRVLDGYVSVRVKPSSELFELARSIYVDVLAVEQKVEGGDVRRRKQAIDAGVARLHVLLAEAGFSSYGAFIRGALLAEVNAREAIIGATAGERLGSSPAGADPRLAAILGACARTHAILDELGGNLEQYATLHDTLAPKSAYMHELAENVRLYSLNALLGATRLGSRGAALGAVADIMRGRSNIAGPVTDALSLDIGGAVDLLAGMGYRIALSKLQTEMMMVFVREQIALADHDGEAEIDLRALGGGLDAGARRLCSSLDDLRGHLEGVTLQAGRLRTELGVLRGLGVNGRIEAARLSDADAVLDLFRTIGAQVVAAREQLADFDAVDRRRVAGDDVLRRRMLAGLDDLAHRMSRLDA